MIARTRKKNTRSNEDALAAFVQRKAEIDAMLSRLQALSDEHFGVAPTRSPGAMSAPSGYYAELLKRVTDSAFQRGRARRIAGPISRPAPRGSSRRGSGS